MAARYTFAQLEALWRRAGGSQSLAPTMAAIALAESGGRVGATHTNANGSVDRGLWQINSVHNYNPQQLLGDPLYNARAAVAVERGSGLGAWSAYNSGAYQQKLPGGPRTSLSVAKYVSPVSPGALYQRVDQGVDYLQPASVPYRALGSGKIYAVGGGFAGGTGQAVYLKLDHPVKVGNTTYSEVYYAETQPLVKQGQHVRAGQALTSGGSTEIGWANGTSPLAPLLGGLGAGTKPTQPGYDMLSFVRSHGGPQSGTVMVTVPSRGGPKQVPQSDVTGGGVNAITGPVSDVGGAIGAAAHAVASPFESIASFFELISSPAFWLRAGEVVGGGILVLLGLYLLAKQVALGGFDVPNQLSPAARQADQTATALQQARLEETQSRADLNRARAETVRSGRTTNQYYLEEPPRTRRSRLAARAEPSNEIPF